MTEKDYVKAHVTMLTCAARYNKRAKAVYGEDTDDLWGKVLATTYLMGVIDMACLYVSAANGNDITESVAYIDGRIDGYMDGSYREEEDAEGKPAVG